MKKFFPLKKQEQNRSETMMKSIETDKNPIDQDPKETKFVEMIQSSKQSLTINVNGSVTRNQNV